MAEYKLKSTKVEEKVVGAYKKVENAFVNTFMVKEGETAEEAKTRVAQEQQARKEMVEKNLEASRNAGKRN